MEGADANGEQVMVVKKSEPVLVRAAVETNGGFYFLSNLDQNIAVIMQTVQLFKANEERSISGGAGRVLREALARVLVHYYPLTGSLDINSEGKLIVRCNGSGVVFVEAVAECGLEILGDTDVSVLDSATLGKLVHATPEAKNLLETPLMTAQVTLFKCGGFSLGTAINHCMVDGIAVVEFLRAWAETARGLPLTTPPFLDRSLLRSRHPPTIEFPHHEFKQVDDDANTTALYRHQRLHYRYFTFDAEKLACLKRAAVGSCTSFTALSAHVWRARSQALGMGPGQKTKLLFAVDGRRRIDPPLPTGFFGNGVVLACCLCDAGELVERPLSFAIELVQGAVRGITGRYIRSAIDCFEATRARPSLAGTLLISAWTSLGFGRLDFGWGEAVQSSPVGLPQKEVALFLSQGKELKGTVLLLGLPVSSMETFQELVQL